MKNPANRKTEIYILTEAHMARLDELISEIQAVYLDIFSNRGLSVTSGMERTPASGLINALSENELAFEDVFEE